MQIAGSILAIAASLILSGCAAEQAVATRPSGPDTANGLPANATVKTVGTDLMGKRLDMVVYNSGAMSKAEQTAAIPPGVGTTPGFPANAVVSALEMDDKGERLVMVIYEKGTMSQARLNAAAPMICKERKLALSSFADKPLDHPAELPGTRKLIVRCK